ncbi:MAG TPA: glutathione S-transferase family protein [Candidatus Binatia bacterium]|nr:glutathione S-transferase family protein [Candidatus Binatia bacterium]
MTELLLYGGPHSSFVRTTRMALQERDVPYTLMPCPPGHVDGDARHPFGKIPFMRYGDFVLAESIAIIRFAEREFPKAPSLWPKDSRRAALCDQWVSAISDSIVARIGFGICFPRLAAPILGFPVDEAAVAAAVARLPMTLDELERPLSRQPYLTGESMSLADLYLVPVVYYLGLTAEGKEVLPRYPALGAWAARMAERASVRDTVPPPFEALRPAA